VACGDGEEDHLRDLADYVDQTVQKLVTSVGQAGDARLLVMASLMIADDLSEALQKLDELEPGAGARDNGAEQDAAGTLENYAERLEKIAARLEAT
jgi:cell division protein ZapA